MYEPKKFEELSWREKFTLLRRTVSALSAFDKWTFPTMIISDLLLSLEPLVNLWMSALILDELIGARDIKRLVVLVLVTVGLNFLLYLGKNALANRHHILHKGMEIVQENMAASEKILDTDYENLENPDFQKKARDYWQVSRNRGSALNVFYYSMDLFFQGFFSTVCSVLLLIPFLKIVLVRTGPSFWESPWLVLALLGVMVACAAALLVVGHFYQKTNNQYCDLNLQVMRLFSYYSDLISNYRLGKEIRLFREKELIMEQAYDKTLLQIIKMSRASAQAESRFGSTNALITAVMTGAIYIFVALKALAGLFGAGDLLKYVGAIQQVATGVENLISGVTLLANLHNTQFFFDLIDTPPVKYQGTLPVEKRDDNDYLIEFKNVSFRYPGAQDWALKDFSIRLRVGERLAVVGMNGSGKTTFIKLLCRLYDPQEGVITLNGIDIKKYDYEEYLTLFSVVFQDFCVFSFPLGQNVTTSLDYDEEKVWRCLEQAGLSERVKQMPKGLDTALYKDFEEDGVEISGGEAQKVALARALYKDAPFIVLDEPTAALDPVSEHEIYERFNQFVGAKTAIYISHRLSSCRFCDQIAVFDQGRLVQTGSHDELILDESGKYYALWHAQAQYYVPEGRPRE